MNQAAQILGLAALRGQCPEWAMEASKFVAVHDALPTAKQGFIALCTNAYGSPQSWRNMAFRSRERFHELALPTTGEVTKQGM